MANWKSIPTPVGAAALALLISASAFAQWTPPPPPGPPPPPPPGAAEAAAPMLDGVQLEQLVAPIALYPDPLLGQMLMAATYPLEIVEASRWIQDPYNAQLQGGALSSALDRVEWDPSVKSLAPFPQVLKMMDERLDWTERLGDAFLAQQSDVMDAVQRLRQRAEAAGTLRSSAQIAVIDNGPAIEIEPAQPQIVYVPAYDPRVAYGPWPYTAYPPDYFDPVPAYGYAGGLGFGIGVAVVPSYWRWHHWDWRRHEIDIDRERWEHLHQGTIQRQYIGRADEARPAPMGGTWQHDPEHRRMVPYHSEVARRQFAPTEPAQAAPMGRPQEQRQSITPQGPQTPRQQFFQSQPQPQPQPQPQHMAPQPAPQYLPQPQPQPQHLPAQPAQPAPQYLPQPQHVQPQPAPQYAPQVQRGPEPQYLPQRPPPAAAPHPQQEQRPARPAERPEHEDRRPN